MPNMIHISPLGSADAKSIHQLQKRMFPRSLWESLEEITEILVNTEQHMVCNLSFAVFDGMKIVRYLFACVESRGLTYKTIDLHLVASKSVTKTKLDNGGVEDGLITVSIADTGEGMSPEFIHQRLFRPFDSTKGSESMGIGAYQARDYVRMLGGQMEVSSEIGVGTTFFVRLSENA